MLNISSNLLTAYVVEVEELVTFVKHFEHNQTVSYFRVVYDGGIVTTSADYAVGGRCAG